MRILVVRLGAMGDVIHTLPAAAALKRDLPGASVVWAVEPRWAPLLAGNPFLDEIVTINRKQWASVATAWRKLRSQKLDLAVDFQGLIKSALVAKASGAPNIIGYSQSRERAAAWFYSQAVSVSAIHVVDRNLELAHAAGARAASPAFWLPPGSAEGSLPQKFVLASPYAGWASKEWPLDHYAQLAKLLPLPLVLNGHPAAESRLRTVSGVQVHISSIAGLIHATRRAEAIVGVDSGPLHLAAALTKPGVAIFGPTDPARNGPYGGSIRVLRAPHTETSYKRLDAAHPAMLAITPEQVAQALGLS